MRKKKTPEQLQFERKFVSIAGMSGDERTVAHVSHLMESNGIQCLHEGSVLYDIYVERAKATRARELLRAAQADGWRVLFPKDHQGQ